MKDFERRDQQEPGRATREMEITIGRLRKRMEEDPSSTVMITEGAGSRSTGYSCRIDHPDGERGYHTFFFPNELVR